MRNLKKFLALVLAMMMVFSLMITVNAATTNAAMQARFEAAYKTMSEYGVFNGVKGATDKDSLDKDFTRAQMAAVAYRIATGDVDDEQVDLYEVYADESFTDLAGYGWAKGYIGFCAQHGIVVGYGNKTFAPGKPVTGYQAAVMMLRLLGYGKKGEFQGSNWQFQTGTLAAKLGITTGLTQENLSGPATRGEAAYIARNGSTGDNAPVQVTLFGDTYFEWTGNGALNSGKLITLENEEKKGGETDVWGAPGATTTTVDVTFNWIIGGAVGKQISTTKDPKLFEFYGAITECDLADMLEEHDTTYVDGIQYAATRTNGDRNRNLEEYNTEGTKIAKIEPLDVVQKVGHEGRWSRVYYYPSYNSANAQGNSNPKYLIVGVDTFYGVVTETWDRVVDPKDHEVLAAGASVRVYYNSSCVDAGSDASSFDPDDDPGLELVVMGKDYVVGQKLGLHIATATATNIMDDTSPNANFTPAATGAVVVEDVELRSVDVTIKSISFDSVDGTAAGTVPIGFKDTNGNQYYYNYTFGDNDANEYVLDGSALNQSYRLLVGAHKNEYGSYDVLHWQKIGTGTGYGVVLGAKVVNEGVGKYYLEYTVLDASGEKQTLKVYDDGETSGTRGYFATVSDAEDYYNSVNGEYGFGALVYWTNYSDGSIFPYQETGEWTQTTDDVFESGRAGAIAGAYTVDDPEFVEGDGSHEVLINENTIIFVAEYKPDTTTPQTANPNDYVFTGYKIYGINGTDFRDLPDLTYEASSEFPADNAIDDLDIQYFVVDSNNEPVTPAGATDFAKYVVVNLATKQTNPPAKTATLDYALIVANDTIIQENDGYYEVPAYLDGKYDKDLMIALNAGAQLASGGPSIGLYSIANYVNGQGYQDVVLMDGTENADPAATGVYDQLVMSIDGDEDFNYAAGVLFDAAADRYLTVVKNCPVYRINPTLGTPSTLSLSALNQYGRRETGGAGGAGTVIWYQLDQFGRINLMYVIEPNMT